MVENAIAKRFRSTWRTLVVVLFCAYALLQIYFAFSPLLGPNPQMAVLLMPLLMGGFNLSHAVVGEKEWGTLELVLTKPLSRTTLLVGKFAAYTLAMVPLIVVELILAYYWAQVSGISTLRWQLPMPPFSQWLAMITILSLLCMLYIAIAIAIFVSLYARNTATSGLMSLIAILPGTPLGTEILKGLGWTDFGKLALPYKLIASLFEGYQVYALTSAFDFWICAFSLLLLAVILLLVAGQRFEKQDIAFRM